MGEGPRERAGKRAHETGPTFGCGTEGGGQNEIPEIWKLDLLLGKILMIYALGVTPLLAADDSLLRWMDGIAQQQLADREAALAKIHTVREAEARQAQVRAKILELLGGLPNYTGPLNARVTGRIDRPRYTIEKVIFESLPQFYVAANLYLPKEGGKHPGRAPADGPLGTRQG